MRRVLNAIATAYRRQIMLEAWLSADKKAGSKYLKNVEKFLAGKSKQARYKWKQKFYVRLEEYIEDERENVGTHGLSVASRILDTLLEEHTDIFETVRGYNKDPKVRFTRQFMANVDDFLLAISHSRPMYRPMVVPPLDWHKDEAGTYHGGYLGIDAPLYRGSLYNHRFNPSPQALTALNLVQQTPWQVNTRALAFCQKLQQSTSTILPTVPADSIPNVWIDAITWETLSNDEQRDVVQEGKDRMASWVSQVARAAALRRKLSMAQEMVDAGNKFWQPHHFDFRGRLYPVCTELTSQGDSWSKGLLQFSEGKPLGTEGLTNLAIHVANCFGVDKLSLDGRIDFINDNIVAFRTACATFEGQCDLASQADEPLPFLAALWELDAALALDEPETFISRTPCAVDGTCNGLQILSLLGRDPVGAKATNCTSDPERQDLYSAVAQAVEKRMQDALDAEAHLGTEEAHAAGAWQDALRANGRKIVKRAVMTTPYGVTEQGIVEQLVKDGHCDGLTIPESWSMTTVQGRNRLARYMCKWIVEARESVVREAMKIMEYLRDTARVLQAADEHLSWVTPDGCEVAQTYWRMRSKKTKTYDLRHRNVLTPTGAIDLKKSLGGSAPNVVHSLDADMLRTVVRTLAALGVTDVAMIHDSYGVHACDIDLLQDVIRAVGVAMFSGDWLRDDMYEGLSVTFPDLDLPLPPEQGTLDVATELPRADYFFS